jgi:aminoglycoside phosphotransferase (APT) family kinase protein
MIPKEKQTAVRRALLEAFGTEEYSNLQELHRGLSSARIYRVTVKGTSYLLRVVMRSDALGDPTRQIACMTAAAAVGIAPRIHYANVEDRVLITDFVEAKPFPDDMGVRMAAVLRKLHALPLFPNLMNYFERMGGVLKQFAAAGIVPAADSAELVLAYDRVMAVYPVELISSHNDLKPDNVLFDGRQVWLIDWEAAFLNDRYTDLAVTANFFVEDEEQFLAVYLGAAPDAEQMARFFLIRVAMSIIYASFFLRLAGTAELGRETSGFVEFHRRLVEGEVYLLDTNAQVEYGLLHLQRALEWVRGPRFLLALELVTAKKQLW